MTLDKCPYCSKSLKGFFSAMLIPQSKTEFINKHLELHNEAYCSNCSADLLNKIANNFSKQKLDIENRLKQIIQYIPIISSQAPNHWDYDIVQMVTAQTTSGSGFSAELSRTFNDFFGTTSNTSNLKIAKATELCLSELRIKCVKLGGNAVIATDIDFNEIGNGNTNMLMIAIAGTAIRVNDINNFNEKSRDYIVEVIELTEKLEAIADLKF